MKKKLLFIGLFIAFLCSDTFSQARDTTFTFPDADMQGWENTTIKHGNRNRKWVVYKTTLQIKSSSRADVEAWVTSPKFDYSTGAQTISFEVGGKTESVVDKLSLLYSEDFTGDVKTATWHNITDELVKTYLGDYKYLKVNYDIPTNGTQVTLAFKYEAPKSGVNADVRVKKIKITNVQLSIFKLTIKTITTGNKLVGENLTLTANANCKAYLVPSSTKKIKADIIAASITTADLLENKEKIISTIGFSAGEFVVFLIDEKNNISDASDTITLTEAGAPILTFDNLVLDERIDDMTIDSIITGTSSSNAKLYLVASSTDTIVADIIAATVKTINVEAGVTFEIPLKEINFGRYVVFAIDSKNKFSKASEVIRIHTTNQSPIVVNSTHESIWGARNSSHWNGWTSKLIEGEILPYIRSVTTIKVNTIASDAKNSVWFVSPEYNLSKDTVRYLNFAAGWKPVVSCTINLYYSTDYTDDATTATWTAIQENILKGHEIAGNGSKYQKRFIYSLETFKQKKINFAFKLTTRGGEKTETSIMKFNISVPEFYTSTSTSGNLTKGQAIKFKSSLDAKSYLVPATTKRDSLSIMTEKIAEIDVKANIEANFQTGNLTIGKYIIYSMYIEDELSVKSFPTQIINLKNSQTTGIINIDNKFGINFFPNPVVDILTISKISNVRNVKVYNILGVLIKNVKNHSDTAFIDMNSFQKGVYFIILEFKNGEKKTIKISKN